MFHLVFVLEMDIVTDMNIWVAGRAAFREWHCQINATQ